MGWRRDLCAGVALLLVLGAGTGSAQASKIDAQEVLNGDFYTDSFILDPDLKARGGKVRCMNGTRIFTGGGYMYEEAQPPQPGPAETTGIASSAPKGGKGWFIAGFESAGGEFEMQGVARCLPKARLADAMNVSKSKALDGDGATAGIRVRCPDGYRLISGGGYISRPGKPPKAKHSQRGYVTSSTPLTKRTWFVAATDDFIAGEVTGRSVVTAVARCLPSNQLKAYEQFDDSISIDADDSDWGLFECPAGQALGPAGLFWHAGDGEATTEFAGETNVFAIGAIETPSEIPIGGGNFSLMDLKLGVRAFCLT